MNNNDRLRQHLSTALDEILAALVLSGDLGDELPDTALDAALGTDPSVQTARQVLDVAVSGLVASEAGDDRHQAILAVEEAVNALVARSTDAACRVGLKVGREMRS